LITPSCRPSRIQGKDKARLAGLATLVIESDTEQKKRGVAWMNKLIGLLLLLGAGAAQAALVDRGGGFIYDDVQDITWAQNTSINGTGDWATQMAWVDSLSIYDSVRNVTWDDWRLPSADVDGNGVIYECNPIGGGYWLETCLDNEMSFMYSRYRPWETGLFTNLRADFYWSGTEYAPSPAEWAWSFAMFNGENYGGDFKQAEWHAWAVRDGDVAASVVPIPAAVWLFGSGLGLLAWFRRRHTA
jgi:hypothetical protein